MLGKHSVIEVHPGPLGQFENAQDRLGEGEIHLNFNLDLMEDVNKLVAFRGGVSQLSSSHQIVSPF